MKMIIAALLFLSTSSAWGYGPYKAELISVVDGDTLMLVVASWPGETKLITARLTGINTAETRTRDMCEKQAGIAAKRFMQRAVDGKELVVTAMYPRKTKFYGRMNVSVSADGEDLSLLMIKSGHARPYTGGKRQPWCGTPTGGTNQ